MREIKFRCKEPIYSCKKDEIYWAKKSITGDYLFTDDDENFEISNEMLSDYFEKVEDVLMVECIDNEDVEEKLSVGKMYEVIKETEGRYQIINDEGFQKVYYKHRFKPIEPQREINYEEEYKKFKEENEHLKERINKYQDDILEKQNKIETLKNDIAELRSSLNDAIEQNTDYGFLQEKYNKLQNAFRKIVESNKTLAEELICRLEE